MASPDSSQKTDSLDALIRAAGGRATRQRRAIYAALAARLDHPTAEDLHREVRRRIPGLSLATVYTTLEMLLRSGAAAKIVTGGGVARFDARTDSHDHRRCFRCGRIDDVDVTGRPDVIPRLPADGFTVARYHVEYLGYCAACNAAGGARREP